VHARFVVTTERMFTFKQAGCALALAAMVALSVVPARAGAATSSPVAWPATIATNGGTIALSEPQVRSWPNYGELTGVAAIAVTLPGAPAPAYGTITFTSLASADVPAGVVTLVHPQIGATNWPATVDAVTLDAFVKANLHLEGAPAVPLAMVLASLPRSERPHTVPLRTNPPVIYVSQRPAVLIVFDGKPRFAPIAGTSLTSAVNTNWEIIHDPATALYYVHARSGWYASPGANGPFAPATFAAIPATGRLQYVKAALDAPKPAGAVPRVFVSMVPAALIDIAGPPTFGAIPGTQLHYVTNTSSDLFFSRNTTAWYVLLAGRWFSAANLNGPWTFASRRLPADFKKIPEKSPRGRVLVSVPGTTQAFYAASAAQVPRITAVDPASATLTVTYDANAPMFAPIAGTSLQYAVNTRTDVVKVDDAHYFACANGVWFAAASPNGPWTAASYVPAVVYTIPASSPLYPVTFVHVYNAQGVALTAPRQTPAPAPAATYQAFAPSQFSNGDRAAYYNTATLGYFSGYTPGWGGIAYGTGYNNPGFYGDQLWVSNFPTYGNYNDTTYARQQAMQNVPRGATALDVPPVPGHGPRGVPAPDANVFAADDGVYRYDRGTWEKAGTGGVWSPASSVPATLGNDLRARLDGYAGSISPAG
jgi:hypothetical protein